ncbi:hypothetical protein DOTSEDRAFT_71564 [Dothistroma septosporum NZE10]|uniref:Uncharacterized protein n=1 Tax=Dothistroma septosporum (strain NZE10 / CBS 128990) TaxID=675120 RepID=N1PK99_DOTSN|nr:hypothetical protein DOTSEDRAFT_71564 [Dothistroma septosporum NZE10]
MSRFFPHSSYAEDQPLAHTLLWSHVLYRGFQTGATLGLAVGATQALLQARKAQRGGSTVQRALLATTLRSTGIGAVAFTALMVPGIVMRMNGREEIEWKDRSWRLMENKGQIEVDDWSLVGTVAGTLAAARRGASQEVGRARIWRLAGGAGAGSMFGVLGYMAWRYGVHGGKWPEASSQ